ncbi:type I glyceraldehyde-3-phosphate dehydrogenase [bacterium]|nr:type I glyceraldehyde-3-phosphate dehydrogenase [bacterium]
MNSKKIIGVNGFGRIGRYFTRLAILDPEVEVGLINDLSDIKTLMHLFKYDSIHGRFNLDFKIEGNLVRFSNGKTVAFSQERDPSSIRWSDFKVSTVVECTGLFLTSELASKHFTGGARNVILSAPAKDDNIKTIVLGVNDDLLSENDRIVSNASCTTNNVAPLIEVMQTLCDIEQGYISTIHSYTSDQRLHDSPHKDLRRARAASHSIIPTSTGAAKAIVKIFPKLEGAIAGGAIRVPVSDGSMTEITLIVDKKISIEEINQAMHKAAEKQLAGILEVNSDPIVSIDVIGSSASSIYDETLSTVFNKMIRIVSWYDNESGYSNRLLELTKKVG